MLPGKRVYFCCKIGSLWKQTQVAIRGTTLFGSSIVVSFFVAPEFGVD